MILYFLKAVILKNRKVVELKKYIKTTDKKNNSDVLASIQTYTSIDPRKKLKLKNWTSHTTLLACECICLL